MRDYDEYDNNEDIEWEVEERLAAYKRDLLEKLREVLGFQEKLDPHEIAFKEWVKGSYPKLEGLSEMITFTLSNTVEFTVVESSKNRFVVESKVVEGGRAKQISECITKNNALLDTLKKHGDMSAKNWGTTITKPLEFKESEDES